MTLKAIDWYINELILRGSGRGGDFGGVLQKFAEPLSRNIKYIFGFFSLDLFDGCPC